jgi:phosphoketolase
MTSTTSSPGGQVYEPLSEDACAGPSAGIKRCLADALAVVFLRELRHQWLAHRGKPLPRPWRNCAAPPQPLTLFTAGALEQGRNGWTHQRPEIENYFGAHDAQRQRLPLFPTDANSIQACYDWALTTRNKGITITASKSPLPIRTTLSPDPQSPARWSGRTGFYPWGQDGCPGCHWRYDADSCV